MFAFFRKLKEFIKWKLWDRKNKPIKRPFGITCFVGLPGQGKTLSLVENLLQLKIQFPKAKIFTNFGFKYEDGQVTSWRDLVDLENGDDGIIFGLDEVHDIFDRKDWSTMPKSVLALFSMNRKHAKQFICTAQNYNDIVVDIRRRCHYIIECRNLANRWIFQRAFAPDNWKEKDGEYKPRIRAWRRSFIASNFIYESYDTYAIIERIRQDIYNER